VQKHYSLVFSSDEEQEGLGADDLMTGLLKEIRTAKKSSKHEKSTRVSGSVRVKNKRNSGGGDVKKVKKSVSKKGKESKRTGKKKTVRKSKGKGTETATQLSDSLRNEYLGEKLFKQRYDLNRRIVNCMVLNQLHRYRYR
jgi:hypothetical protein